MKEDPERAIGGVGPQVHGKFDFDLPLSNPKVNEVSEGDRTEGKRYDSTAPKPTEQAVTAAYKAMHDAALKKDLKGLLAAQGFDAKQIAAIRGLDGIDADFLVYADRFLVPGAADEVTVRPGTGYVRTEGTNSKGQKFANFYHFAPCGESPRAREHRRKPANRQRHQPRMHSSKVDQSSTIRNRKGQR